MDSKKKNGKTPSEILQDELEPIEDYMKIEYKLLVKINPNDKFIILEYNEEQKVLEEKQKILKTMFPDWYEVLVIRQQYNVS